MKSFICLTFPVNDYVLFISLKNFLKNIFRFELEFSLAKFSLIWESKLTLVFQFFGHKALGKQNFGQMLRNV